MCKSCGRTFSEQTFSYTYYQKKPELDSKIMVLVANGMCNRQISRFLEVDPATIDSKISRLGRHCLLFLAGYLEKALKANEIVFDGFETFEFSQFFPFHHNLAVDKATDYLLFFNDSELRRKGRMTDAQKRRRAELEELLGRPDPKAIEQKVTEMLDVIIRRQKNITMFTDDHPQYRRPIRKHMDLVKHLVTPGKAHRDANNSLSAINLLDRFLRHSSANHVRETIAWSKRRNSSAEKLAIFAVWRNFLNPRRQKIPHCPSPAMELGLTNRILKPPDILQKRLFFGHFVLPESWEQYYRKEVSTRALPVERRHCLKYAF